MSSSYEKSVKGGTKIKVIMTTRESFCSKIDVDASSSLPHRNPSMSSTFYRLQELGRLESQRSFGP